MRCEDADCEHPNCKCKVMSTEMIGLEMPRFIEEIEDILSSDELADVEKTHQLAVLTENKKNWINRTFT